MGSTILEMRFGCTVSLIRKNCTIGGRKIAARSRMTKRRRVRWVMRRATYLVETQLLGNLHDMTYVEKERNRHRRYKGRKRAQQRQTLGWDLPRA
jgi:hypothetical protein